MNVWKFFEVIFKSFPLIFLFNVLILILAGGVEAFSVFSIAPIIDFITDPTLVNASDITKKFIFYFDQFGIIPSIKSFSILFIFMIFVKSMINLMFKYISLVTKYLFLEKFMVGAFANFFNSGMPFFNSIQQGVLLNTFNTEISTVGNSISSMSLLFSNFIRFLFFISIPLTISVKLTAMTIGAFALVSLPSLFTDKISFRMGAKNVDTSNRVQIVLQESLSSVKVILGFGNGRKAIRYFKENFDNHRKVTIPFQMISSTLINIYEPILMIVLIGVLYFSLNVFKVKLSDVLVILYAFKNMVPLILSVMSEKNNIAGFIPSYQQVEMLENKSLLLQVKEGEKVFEKLKDKIVLSSVSFSYAKDKAILKNISLEIPKGKMVALVGKSGSGKTTIADLVMGFYHPDAGQVLIDGEDLKNFNTSLLREKIGFVSQEPVLFNQTIRENLLWAKENATDEEIREALTKSHALDFINRIPEGLEAKVGDRGTMLSGGERQRIAFARAILRKPDLLILDEATSALDSESEKIVQVAIQSVAKNCTTLVIAHRLSTIKEADLIYVIDNGVIIETGTYENLIERNGAFKQLIQNQQM